MLSWWEPWWWLDEWPYGGGGVRLPLNEFSGGVPQDPVAPIGCSLLGPENGNVNFPDAGKIPASGSNAMDKAQWCQRDLLLGLGTIDPFKSPLRNCWRLCGTVPLFKTFLSLCDCIVTCKSSYDHNTSAVAVLVNSSSFSASAKQHTISYSRS